MTTIDERLSEIAERLDSAVEQTDIGRAAGDLCIAVADLLEVVRMQQEQIARLKADVLSHEAHIARLYSIRS